MADADGDLTDLRFVGPATAAVLRDADVSASDVAERRVDHETLVEAGVNPGVAARLRKEHSLAWSHSTGGDLSRRADHVRGLGDAERSWVAASSGDWEDQEPAESDGETEDWRSAESSWQERSAPEPVTVLDDVDEADAERLAKAGVTSVRALAVADAAGVAESLDLDESVVAEWKAAAQAHRD